MNTRFERLPERAKTLALQVGDSLRDKVPDRAMHWMETGTALGAVKSGTRVATKFARRNPTLLVAAAAGAGRLWYAARRRRGKQQAGKALRNGSSQQVDARRMDSLADDSHTDGTGSSSAQRMRAARTDANQASPAVSGG
jgi:hypothetical protein